MLGDTWLYGQPCTGCLGTWALWQQRTGCLGTFGPMAAMDRVLGDTKPHDRDTEGAWGHAVHGQPYTGCLGTAGAAAKHNSGQLQGRAVPMAAPQGHRPTPCPIKGAIDGWEGGWSSQAGLPSPHPHPPPPQGAGRKSSGCTVPQFPRQPQWFSPQPSWHSRSLKRWDTGDSSGWQQLETARVHGTGARGCTGHHHPPPSQELGQTGGPRLPPPLHPDAGKHVK